MIRRLAPPVRACDRLRRPDFAQRCAQVCALVCVLGWGGIFPQPLKAAETDLALQLPNGAEQLTRRETVLGSYALPVGAYSAEGIRLQQAEGHILRRTWQLRGDATVLQVLDPLRSQLRAQGYEILFQCPERQCGGFDFRFGIEVVPAPDMVVSLSDYYFLAVAKPQASGTIPEAGSAGGRVASLLVSRSGPATYVQLIEVAPAGQPTLAVAAATPAPLTSALIPPLPTPQAAPLGEPSGVIATTGLAAHLADVGHAVLEGLVFDTGSVALGQASVNSLESLSGFLDDTPDAQILIVGHTDTIGGLQDNIVLSLRRATAVKEALVEKYAIASDRIQVAGAGFMAPISSNLSAEGREKNRRVEVVLTRD